MQRLAPTRSVWALLSRGWKQSRALRHGRQATGRPEIGAPLLVRFSDMKVPLITFLAFGALALMAAPLGASANVKPVKPPVDVPAIAEYIEPNPTLAGPVMAGGAPTHVSSRIARAITKAGGADATPLLALAGSGGKHVRTSRRTSEAIATPRGTNITGAAASSTGLSYGSAIGLGAILLLISVACGAAAARRYSTASPSR